MSDIKITFSKYATLFYKHIDGCKTPKALFVKDILKMGLSEEDRNYIDENFPTQINCKGKSSIEKNKADRLRKYLRGENGISEIVDELVSDFDLEFQERYSEELQDYEDEKLINLAKELNLNIDTNNIETVAKDIAAIYSNLMKSQSKQTISMNNSKDNNLRLSYTITADEKQEIKNVCSLIRRSLNEIEFIATGICRNQSELAKLSDTESNNVYKQQYEYNIKSAEEKLSEKYNGLETYCGDAMSIIEPKKHLLISLNDIYELSSEIINRKPEYSKLFTLIKNYQNAYDKLLREIDKV